MRFGSILRARTVLLSATLLLVALAPRLGAAPVLNPSSQRVLVEFPQVGDYQTLKCDLHVHTVFSDGQVWPSVRVREAWCDGLDAIAITDHIEYLPHKGDLGEDLNRSCDIAAAEGRRLGIIVIRGSEVTRSQPTGHHNVIFTTDNNAFKVEGFLDALDIAKKQGAFIFYNHPGWQSPTRSGYWNENVHDAQYERGMMNGIEVINGRSYFPDAHRWAVEKKLTMIASSDVHAPIAFDYAASHGHGYGEAQAGDHRPVTLVFVRTRDATAIKEALFARRTAIWAGDKLYGEKRFLEPIFKSGVRVERARTLTGKASVLYTVRNALPVPVELEAIGEVGEVSRPATLFIPSGRAVLMHLGGKSGDLSGEKTVALPYRVRNMWTGPTACLETTLEVPITFVPEPSKD